MLLLSFPIALLAAMQLPSVLGAMWDEEYAYEIPARLIGDGLIPVVLILASIIVASFTTCVKVVWPRGFKGEHHSMVLIGANEWNMLIECLPKNTDTS
jgi:hypothetical protein